MDAVSQQIAKFQADIDRLTALKGQLSAMGQPVAQQSPIASNPVDAQQDLLLKLYEEFVNTDEGKQLAANLARFARFAQSKVAKKEA